MALLMNHFGTKDQSPNAIQLRQHKWFIKARQDRQKQKEADDAKLDDLMDLAVAVVVVTEVERRNFQIQLDSYDEATVKALELNQQQIDAIKQQLLQVDARLQQKLDNAYIMEDGRRVFLTEDRSQAFDEHGTEVTRDELDFDLVPEENFTWESVQEDIELKDQLKNSLDGLEKERTDIFDYQEKLDAARERSNADDFSKDELEDFDTELLDLMPDAVKRQMPGYDPPAPTPEASTAFQATANPVIQSGANTAKIQFQTNDIK